MLPELAHPLYRKDIDGLRAIAVLLVVGYHAFPDWIKGGFAGVDIFFVISGFLISSIIMNGLHSGSFSFIEFYIRRIKRIFPALILVMACSYVFGWFALLPDEFMQLGKHIAAGAGFVSNLFFWQEAGYFNNAAETKPMLHLWSLGIEEQFYIVWPLLLYWAWRWQIKHLFVSVTIVAISFIANIGLVHIDTVEAFYSPLTRFWELLLGSILAYFALRSAGMANKRGSGEPGLPPGQQSSNAASLLGALLIGLAGLLIKDGDAFPGWWALLPTMGGYLIIWAGQHAWLNRTLLSHPVLVWFGLISYPLYLWHWPLLSYARIMESRTPDVSIRLAAVALAVALAWLTYRFLECPLRRGKRGVYKALVLLLCMTAMAGAGIAANILDGFNQRSAMQQVVAQLDEFAPEKFWDVWMPCEAKGAPKGCRIMDSSKLPDVALLGDSHAMELVFGLDNLFRPSGKNIIARAKPGCSPFFEKGTEKIAFINCNGFMEQALTVTETTQSIKTIILSGYGMAIIKGTKWLSRQNERPDMGAHSAAYQSAMDITLKRLVSTGKKIVFIVDVPELNFDPKECVPIRPVYLPGHRLKSPCAISTAEFEKRTEVYHRIIEAAKQKFPSVRFIDSYKYFCDEQRCSAVIDGELMYRDNNHLNVRGSQFLAEKIAEELLE